MPLSRHIDVTIDVVLFCVQEETLKVVLTTRSKSPFEGMPALPGGYVHAQEDADSEASAYRMLWEKVGLRPGYLEQLHTYASRDRDPRGWSASIAYYALVSNDLLSKALGGTEEFKTVPVKALPEALAFDHAVIIADALERLSKKSDRSTLPLFLAEPQFTLNEVQLLYEHALGRPQQTANFRRWLKTLDVLRPVLGQYETGMGRHAQVYELDPSARLIGPEIVSPAR